MVNEISEWLYHVLSRVNDPIISRNGVLSRNVIPQDMSLKSYLQSIVETSAFNKSF